MSFRKLQMQQPEAPSNYIGIGEGGERFLGTISQTAPEGKERDPGREAIRAQLELKAAPG